MWETTWRGDVSPLSTVPVNVLLYTPIGSYVHLVPSIQIKTTLISAPERYLLRLPNTTTNQLTVVYLRVKNPFNMPVHFRIKTFDSYFPSTIASNLNILSPSPNLETMQSDYFYLKSSFQMHDSNTTVASSQSPSQKPSSRLKSKRRSAYIVPTMGGFSSVSGRIVSEKAAADKDAATSSPSISRRRPIPVETKRSVLSIDPMFAWERFVGNEVIPDEAFVIGARSRIVPLTKSQIQEISGSTDQAVFAHPDAAYLAAPLESFLLGPVFFVPTLSVDVASAVVQYADIYLVNSFSGVDKVEVATVIGNPFLRLESLQVASHGSLQSVDVVASKKLHVDFNSSIDTVHISIANDGFTPTTITDVIIDGVSCKRKKSNAAIVCRGIKLPRYLVEDSMWTFDINGLSSCNYRARDHSVVLEMIPLTPADDAEDNSNFSSLEIKFSSRLQASCKYEIRNSRIFWTVLVLVIGALITWAFMEFMKYSAIEDNSANSKQKKVKKKIVSALPTIQAPLAGAHLEPLLVPINTKRSEITPARSTGSSPRDDASKASLSAREYLPVSPGPLSSLLRLTPDPSYLLTNARKGIDEPIVVTSKRTRKRLVKERKAIGSPEAASGLESPPASNTPSPRSTTNSQASPKIPLNFISLVDSLAREIPLEIVTSVETEIQFDAFIDSGPTSLESIHMDKKDFKVEDFKVDIPEMHEDTSETVESPVEDESSVEPIVLSPDIDNCAENFHFIDPETEIASDFSSEHINMATSVDVEHSDLTPKIVHSLALEREESESPLRLLPNDLSDVKEAGESSPSISGPPPGLESTQHVQVTPDYRSSQSSLFYRSLSRPFAPVSSENVTAHVGPSITDIYNATGSETFSSFDYDIRTPNLSVKESVPFTSSPKRANLGSSNAYYEPEPRIQSSINFGGYEFVSTGSVPISAIASTDVRRAPPAQLRVSPISDHPYRQPAMIPYQAPFRHQSDLSVNASLSQNRHQMPSDFSRPSDEMLFPGESSLRPSMHSQSFVSQLSSNIHGQQQQQQQRPIFTPQNQNWPPETMSTSSASLDQDTYLQMEGQLKYLGLDDDYDDDDGDDSKK